MLILSGGKIEVVNFIFAEKFLFGISAFGIFRMILLQAM
jgi:hypothetical protein